MCIRDSCKPFMNSAYTKSSSRSKYIFSTTSASRPVPRMQNLSLIHIFYDYDVYDMVDISQLAVGDTIVVDGKDMVVASREDVYKRQVK